MKMKMNKVIRFFLLSLTVVELCGAFTVLSSWNTKSIRSGVTENDTRLVNACLFHANHQSCVEQSEHGRYDTRNEAQTIGIVKRISRKLKIGRSVISFRISSFWNKNRKRCLPIIAAAIIAAGAFPSHVTANVASSTGTAMSNPASITRTVFECPDSINDETIASDDYEYVTTAGDFPSSEPVVEDVSQLLATGVKHPPKGNLMILNDKMVKKGLRNIAIVGGGAMTLPFLKKKVYASDLDKNDIIDYEGVQDGNDKTVLLGNEVKTETSSAYVTTKKVLPLSDPKYIKARAQPKSHNEEVALAARYSEIPTVEERAYQILIDLGMIEVTQ